MPQRTKSLTGGLGEESRPRQEGKASGRRRSDRRRRVFQRLLKGVADEVALALSRGEIPKERRGEARRLLMQSWIVLHSEDVDEEEVGTLVRQLDALTAKGYSTVAPCALSWPLCVRERGIGLGASEGILARRLLALEHGVRQLTIKTEIMVKKVLEASPRRLVEASQERRASGGREDFELVWGEGID